MRFKPLGALLLAFFIAFSLVRPSLAQGQAVISVYNTDFTKFPNFRVLMDVYDAENNFVSGLNDAQVTLLEDGKNIRSDTLVEKETPLYFVTAINAGPALAVRDGLGVSRYDKLVDTLKNWAAGRPENSPDDLSLTWNGGIVASHVSIGTWENRLDGFDPQLRSATPNLAALSYALDTIQDATPPPGAKKAILFISGHLDNQTMLGMDDLTTRAKQANVRIYTWVVDSASFLTHPGSGRLRQLSSDTIGQTADFSGSESMPNLEAWLGTLRYTYELTYTSKITEKGQHSLSVQIASPKISQTSAAIQFEIDIAPPTPILLSLPVQVIRLQNEKDPFDLENNEPRQQPVEILIDFPDKHERAIVHSALFVDEVQVDENTEPPFNRFTWDLRSYIAPEESHNLRVEITDALGLKGSSASVPVQVIVIQPPGGMIGFLMRNTVLVTFTGLFIALAVLLSIIFVGGRWSLNTFAERRKAQQRKMDPVTQPLEAHIEPPSKPAQASFPWMRRKAAPPQAYLVKLTPDRQPAPGDPISLSAVEMTIGTDPTQSTHVLGDASISPLHARLRRDEQGNFLLLDQNSIAGTWVNHQLILPEGHLLNHGDVVNFGKLTYRFVSGKPPVAKKPKITSIKDE